MRILITAAGSHGDVVPYTGLGVCLREAGHEVVLATHPSFAARVAECGLGFRPLPGDPRTDAAAPTEPPGPGGEGTGAPTRAGGAPRGRALLRQASTAIRLLGEGIADAADPGTDLLLLSNTTATLGRHVAEAIGADCLGAALQPTAPTGEFPPVVGPTRSLGRWGNRAAGRFALRVVDRLHRDAVRDLRARLGLPAATGGGAGASTARRRRARSGAGAPVPYGLGAILHGFSPVLVPRPADWGAGLDVVGTWWPHLRPEARLPEVVEDFLGAGPPPVFIGFGSMGGGEGERLSGIATEALRRAGLRGILQAGWAGLAACGDDVLTVGDVPHALLFPRAAAVVHHAGAGTTAAALRAGVPSVPVPVTADQPFWARRVAALGAGTEPIPYRALTADRLAEALRQAVHDGAYRERAASAARRMAAEDGAGRVAEVIRTLERAR
ncbi:nucleotide disphospho-sugar-binding domain-containing protein [Streptomyces sp. XD-27]|uniref:nucleotide disphospho-sugar-binding domain-containing protein n=1 Tax=Streptomyces sp. XD-27 TaxID=3062779 RepID=UPI0026F4757F|nr:nucleotide disphospho-sugar-binding domain-containing protein [Streptomyces sp. XD-27]WKX71689.1 glycosyltransferase [Streptomyces sp. XD-27]